MILCKGGREGGDALTLSLQRDYDKDYQRPWVALIKSHNNKNALNMLTNGAYWHKIPKNPKTAQYNNPQCHGELETADVPPVGSA